MQFVFFIYIIHTSIKINIKTRELFTDKACNLICR